MIRVTTTGSKATVAFAYDEKIIAIVKGMPGRRWDPGAKHWTVDARDARALASQLARAGYVVSLDGKLVESGSAGALTGDPLEALFRQLPVHLREPVYRALSRVLHPDLGGDAELMKQLNNASGR